MPVNAPLPALAAGTSLRSVSRVYGIHRNALQRHKVNHPNPGLVTLVDPASVAPRVAGDPPSVLQMVAKLDQLEQLQQVAAGRGNVPAALQAAKQASALIEIIGRIRGEYLPPAPVPIDLATHPEWAGPRGLRSRILWVFDRHKDDEMVSWGAARQELADALE
jgi:hypothetical protein